MTGYDGRGGRYDITAPASTDLSIVVTAPVTIDLSTATCTAVVYNALDVSVGSFSAAISGSASNVATVTVTDAQLDAMTAPSSWAFIVDRGGDAKVWIAGAFTVTPPDQPRPGTSDNTVSVTTPDAVTVTIAVAAIGAEGAALNDLSDVTITTPILGNSLIYDGSGWSNSTPAGGGDLLSTANLSDLADAATARTNLGLGTAAVAATGDFDPAGSAAAAQAASQPLDADLTAIAAANNSVALAAVTGTNTGDEAAASATVAGVVELATIAEVDTGTDTDRAITPAGLAGSALALKVGGIAAGAEVNTVDSVNTATGAVVLDADDISDAATTNKWTNATDISKLAAIEAGATADQSASELLTAIKTVDGSGSGLDADTLRGTTPTTAGLALLDDADNSAQRTTLGLGTMATATATDYQTKASFPGSVSVALSDMTTQITTGQTKAYWVNPYDAVLTITKVRATLATAGSGATVVDINEGAGVGTSILSTKITIDASTTDSDAAGTPPVVSDASIAADGRLTFDIDTAGTSAAGLLVHLTFTRSV